MNGDKTERAKALMNDYFNAAPDRPVPVKILNQVVASTVRHHGAKSAVVAANALLEWSMHPDLPNGRRPEFAQQAGVLILTKIMNAPGSHSKIRIDPLRTHLPLFAKGPTKRAMYLTKREICERIESVGSRQLEAGESGMRTEDTFDLLMGHTGIAGLMVLSTTERQNAGGVTVDDFAYAWDRTVISDGSVLKRGEYRVQVKKKAKLLNGHAPYHPEIAVVCGDTHLGINTSSEGEFTEFYAQLKAAGDEGGGNLVVRRARGALLERLDAVGPIEESRSILPAA